MVLFCVSPCYSLLASLLPSVARWLNMGRVPYQERVAVVWVAEGERVLALVVVEGDTFRLKSQPV